MRNDVCVPVEQNALKEEVNELQYKQEQLECLNASLLHQVDRLKEEKEEREREAVSYCNALEVWRGPRCFPAVPMPLLGSTTETGFFST